MKVLAQRGVLLLGLAVAISAAAQNKSLGASITSGSTMGYPPASVLSFNPQTQSHPPGGGNYHPGPYCGPGSGCKSYSPPPPNNYRHHRNNNYYGGNYGYGYGYIPYYVPSYYSYPYYGGEPVMVMDPSALPGAGTFNTYPPPQSEPMPQGYYSPSAGQNSVREEMRYGTHYTDYRETAPAPAPPPSATGTSLSANGNESSDVMTVLIFKDGHQMEVANYAVMNDFVFIFTGTRRKIPLAELDLPATTKANEERGTDFHLPGKADPS